MTGNALLLQAAAIEFRETMFMFLLNAFLIVFFSKMFGEIDWTGHVYFILFVFFLSRRWVVKL